MRYFSLKFDTVPGSQPCRHQWWVRTTMHSFTALIADWRCSPDFRRTRVQACQRVPVSPPSAGGHAQLRETQLDAAFRLLPISHVKCYIEQDKSLLSLGTKFQLSLIIGLYCVSSTSIVHDITDFIFKVKYSTTKFFAMITTWRKGANSSRARATRSTQYQCRGREGPDASPTLRCLCHPVALLAA